jgi:hypothetical protein
VGFKEQHNEHWFIQHYNKGTEEEMRFKKYTAIHDYINHNDLLQKLGYREYKSKVGGLGKAMLEACRKSEDYRSISWLKHQLNSYFKKLKEEKKNKKVKNDVQKQDSRHSLRPNA